jgi:two-component system, chemotaxis family, protein-glutamate methylesterase/glutaminase
MIRVLVAEDSPSVRALLVHILSGDPEIQVVGEARDGVEAVALTAELRPDLVTMDIHMPRMDGIEATVEIMNTTPTPIVIVTGSTGKSELQTAMELIRAGALEVLFKPPAPSSPHYSAAARSLVATVKSLAQVKVVRHWRSAIPGAPPKPAQAPNYPARASTSAGGAGVRVVAVATSTGGPAALQCLLSGLPSNFPVPIMVVQHISSGFTGGLVAWLNSVSPVRVKLAEQGEMTVSGTVYVAPDDRHLGISRRGEVTLSMSPPIGGFRPSGTILFESAGHAFGRLAVAVVLTGMGEDGVSGLKVIRQTGGRIIAQDEKSSVVFGMSGAAIAAGLADFVLPLNAIASRLIAIV